VLTALIISARPSAAQFTVMITEVLRPSAASVAPASALLTILMWFAPSRRHRRLGIKAEGDPVLARLAGHAGHRAESEVVAVDEDAADIEFRAVLRCRRTPPSPSSSCRSLVDRLVEDEEIGLPSVEIFSIFSRALIANTLRVADAKVDLSVPCSSVVREPDSSFIVYAVIVSVTPAMVASCFSAVSMRTIELAV